MFCIVRVVRPERKSPGRSGLFPQDSGPHPPQQCPWLRAFPELGRAPGDHKGPLVWLPDWARRPESAACLLVRVHVTLTGFVLEPSWDKPEVDCDIKEKTKTFNAQLIQFTILFRIFMFISEVCSHFPFLVLVLSALRIKIILVTMSLWAFLPSPPPLAL